ncbi:Stk1 family PASTA domain-containing Ser/Thr kinase [Blautia sp.]|uniref:Stk1 family PASTA domain-containing Ser/Thr kinase n=1 Tax=Blautia sp. TaxID=1955243 RepID=UPI003FD82A23
MLKTGMIIAERYEIVGKIGTGGMADVYKAMDHKLNRFVAVKVLKPEFREDTTFIKKFRSEAQAAAGLTHPNIVNVFDVGDDGGVYYIVMELIEGITLKEYISKKGKLSIKEATSIAIQVSMGLEAAHSHGIVHRDVKPQNIIISTDGKVKVTDFGIARAASSNTISSNVMGSVHYSSPEQVRGGYSDEKSDIYSLGITLYEMVTGRVPFDGDTTVAIAIKHLQEEMVPPSVYTPDLPYSLEQIILKCTQKSVDRRYSRMEDVIADLKHSLIDPQGDFVRLTTVDNDAKTVVISEEELGEIKHTPKQITKPEITALEEEKYDDNDYDDAEEEYRPRSEHRSGKKKKHHGSGRGLTIAALIGGAVLLIVLVVVLGRAAGLFGTGSSGAADSSKAEAKQESAADGLATVPDLVGKTEEEAKTLANDAHLGVQMAGEEASDQEKGRISRQETAAGTQVEANTTVKYWVSTGTAQVTIPDLDGRTGIDAQQTLEDLGLQVNVQKEYSDTDDNGYALVDPGYVYNVEPAAGTSVQAGSSVTLTVSRGVDYGDNAEVPSVVGMTKDDALTTLGKFIDIQITEQQSTEAAGTVIAQDPEAYAAADPDQPISITISSGDQAPSTDSTASTDNTAYTDSTASTDNTASTDSTVSTTTSTADVNANTGWKCTQTLDTPSGYNGGAIRLELIQDVNGEPKASTIIDGQNISFPYQLDISGAEGVTSGTIYLYEEVDGDYQQLGTYTVTFKKAE